MTLVILTGAACGVGSVGAVGTLRDGTAVARLIGAGWHLGLDGAMEDGHELFKGRNLAVTEWGQW